MIVCQWWSSGKQDDVTWQFVMVQWEVRWCYMIVCQWWSSGKQDDATWLWWCNRKQDDVTWLCWCNGKQDDVTWLWWCSRKLDDVTYMFVCNDSVASKMMSHDCLWWCSEKQDDFAWRFVFDDAGSTQDIAGGRCDHYRVIWCCWRTTGGQALSAVVSSFFCFCVVLMSHCMVGRC